MEHIFTGFDAKVFSLRIAWHDKQRDLFEIVKTDSPERWQAIREIYSLQKRIAGDGYEAYPVDWTLIFTPIERMCWNAMRCLGGLPFNPQYPVDGFFVDFGDPVAQIAIECDGARWHDAGRDAQRDAVLCGIGWTVYRATGRQCNLPDDDPQSIYQMLRRIGERHYAKWDGHYAESNFDIDD